jgi:protein-disulfide isomerase
MNAKNEPTSGQSVTRRERRAAERAARRGGTPVTTTVTTARRGPSMLVISVAAIIIGFVIIVALIGISGGLGSDGTDMPAVVASDIAPPAQELRQGRSLGDPSAPVRIEVFEDFQCPACGLYTERIEPLLIAGPVADGTAFVTIKDFPFLGTESLDAAVAARVAEDLDGKFWDYHGLLFHNQQGENQGAFSRDRLADMAVLAGLDRQAFLDGLDDSAYQTAIEAEHAEGVELGVSSTPTLIVNGELVRGVPSWDDLAAVIATAASGQPADGGSAAASGAPAE